MILSHDVHSQELGLPQRPLPETLDRRYALSLLFLEALCGFGVSTLLLATRAQRIGAGLLLALLFCGISAFAGRYRRTYAVHARDALYYIATAWFFTAVPAIAILTFAGGVSWHSSLMVTVAFGVVVAFVDAALAQVRLPSGIARASLPALSPEAWFRREQAHDRISKRLFDVAVATLALVIFSPVMAAVALAVFLDSGAPVFFRQERVGAGGRSFWIFKFRTMRTDAGSAWATPGDSRITRIGAFLRRTSLDELPQLFNVLRGEMSVVGPRPEMRGFADDFNRTIPHYAERHVVPPGITGWAQVYLKRNLEPSDVPLVLPYDLFYVEHASRFLDCAILLKTAFEVMTHRAV